MTIVTADDLQAGDVIVAPADYYGETVEWTTLAGGLRLVKTDKRETKDLIRMERKALVNVRGRQ